MEQKNKQWIDYLLTTYDFGQKISFEIMKECLIRYIVVLKENKIKIVYKLI